MSPTATGLYNMQCVCPCYVTEAYNEHMLTLSRGPVLHLADFHVLVDILYKCFIFKEKSVWSVFNCFARLHTLLPCVKQLIHGRKERTVTVCDNKYWAGQAGSNLRRSRPISDALAK